MADHRLSIKRHRGKYPRISSTPDRGENRLFVIIVLAHEAISIGIDWLWVVWIKCRRRRGDGCRAPEFYLAVGTGGQNELWKGLGWGGTM